MRYVVMLAALLIVAPLTQAGTMDDPEISDPGTDSGVHDTGMDVDAVWVEHVDDEEGPRLQFFVHVGGDPQHVAAFFAAHQDLRIGFTTDAMPGGVAEHYVSVRPSCPSTSVVLTSVPDCTSESVSCKLGHAAAAEGYEDVSTETTLEPLFPDSQTFGCVVPYAELDGFAPGHSVSDMYLLHRLIVRGPLSGGDQVGPETVETFDRAPDSGVGRVFTTPAPAPDVVYQNISALPFENSTTEAVTGVFQYNWTGVEHFLYMADIQQGTLLLNVTVAGTQVLSWNGTEPLAETGQARAACVDAEIQPEACSVAFRYALTDFVGSYGIGTAPLQDTNTTGAPDGTGDQGGADGGSGGNGTTGDGEAAGNETVDGSGEDRESPGVGWLVPLGMVAVVGGLRRRR